MSHLKMMHTQEFENHVLVPLSVVELEAVIAVVERFLAGADQARILRTLFAFEVPPEVGRALCDAVTLSPVLIRLKSLIPEWRREEYVAACESPKTARTEEIDGNDS